MEHRYAIYIRVSTQRQGASGLGLEAQRKTCEDFVNANGGVIDKEFCDVESGTHRDRKGLWAAIEYCKTSGASLVIAKLDRLARDVEFTFKVINTGVDIHFCDMPSVNTMVLGVFAAVAQYERELISARTKAAIKAKKARGGKIGAASDKYYLDKVKAQERAAKAATTRARRVLENRDNVALIRIMKAVFPLCATTPETQWCQSYVSTKREQRLKIVAMMTDYKAVDDSGTLFAKWDLSDPESVSLQHRLASKMQTIIKILNNQQQ